MTRKPEDLSDFALDEVTAGGRNLPYGQFNFQVQRGGGDAASFDGRFLTAADLSGEQDRARTAGFSDVSGIGVELQVAE